MSCQPDFVPHNLGEESLLLPLASTHLAAKFGCRGAINKITSSPFTLSRIHWEKTMSIFGKIVSAIFGHSANATPPAGGATPGGGTVAGGTGGGGSAAGGAPSSTAATVEVAPILDKAVAAHGEKLEWRTSIVDLMKALDIDSSLAARKELAKELGYTGDTNDSASMNVWLHKQVMAKLAANGGKLPPEIKH
jgi:hypothetical protein